MTVVNRPSTPRSVYALIVVDVQNDFTEGGNLAVEGGTEVAARITRWIQQNADEYATIVATADWHTHATEGHFAEDGEEPNFATTWPVHCMAEGEGSDFHPNLELPDGTVVFRKGQTDASYSGFDGEDEQGRTLKEYLATFGVTHVHVVGLALDFCVNQTALDAAKNGFKTTVWEDLSAAVSAETETKAKREMSSAGVQLVRAGAKATQGVV